MELSYDFAGQVALVTGASAGIGLASRDADVSSSDGETPDAMQEVLRDQPIARLDRPEEIAAAVLWLCSSAASFVVGAALEVDGGFTAH